MVISSEACLGVGEAAIDVHLGSATTSVVAFQVPRSVESREGRCVRSTLTVGGWINCLNKGLGRDQPSPTTLVSVQSIQEAA